MIDFDIDMVGMEADLVSVLALVVAPELVHVSRPVKAPGRRAASARRGRGPRRRRDFCRPRQIQEPRGARRAARDRCAAQPDDPSVEIFVQPANGKPARANVRQSAATAAAAHRSRRGAAGNHRPPRNDKLLPGAVATEGVSIRVSVEKIDRLVNLAGELVITEACWRAAWRGAASATWRTAKPSGPLDLARHTRNLQDAVMSVRMVPISRCSRASRGWRASCRSAWARRPTCACRARPPNLTAA